LLPEGKKQRAQKYFRMELKRELSLADVFTVTAGSMISSGLFIIPGIAYAKAGPAATLSYLLAAMVALPTMLSAAELATAMPKAGGVYFFVSRSMGFNAGTAAGFARWLAISLKSAFSLIGIGVYLAFIANVAAIYISVALCIVFITINLLGIKVMGKTQTVLTVALIFLLLVLALSGLFWISGARFSPFAPHGPSSVLSTAGFVFISYGGMLTVTGLSEEVREPEKNIPLGMLLALAFTGVIYTLVILVVVGVLDSATLTNTLTPVSEGAKTYLGHTGVAVSTIAALLAFVTTANAGIASASRYPLAMSRDCLLPRFFQQCTAKTCIPYFAVLSTGAFILSAIIFLKLERLVEVASTLLIFTYILTNLSVIVMRTKKDPGYNIRFRAPLYPWIQVFSIGGLLLLVVKIGLSSFLLSLVFITASFAWYWLNARVRNLKVNWFKPDPRR
jgi:amino acid transporter